MSRRGTCSRFRPLTTCAALLASLLTLAGVAAAAMASAPAGGCLLRFPDVHGDTVVFVCGEDIWKAPAVGGIAVRLTINDGEERFPKFSPDGSRIAFTGQYDGNTDVYVMDADGGNITRLTYHPGPDEVVGWHPMSGKIVFSSSRNCLSRAERLFMVNPDGSGLEEIPLFEVAQGDFSADGQRLAYNKMSREFRTWKRYQGGMAQDIFLHDFRTGEDRRLTDFPGTDRIPMWIGDRIYFSSDRDGTLNIYALDPATRSSEQITHHTEYDVRRPSTGDGRIVYELGGDLWLLDPASGGSARIPIEVRSDAPEARPYLKDVHEFITDTAISPGGKRVLVVARGEVFSVPAEHGPTRNLSHDSGARDQDAVWSPDGRQVAFISDRDGEYQIYLVDPRGLEKPRRLTDFRDGYRHTLKWSPDSKQLAFTDQALRLWVLDISSRKLTEVDRAEYENIDVSLDVKPIYDYCWSPDSRYIAYSKMDANQLYQLYIHDLEAGESHLVSDGFYHDFNPTFSRDGEHLFFASNRRFDPTFGDFEWEMVYKKSTGIYALTLRADGPALLFLQSDEEPADNGGSSRGNKKKTEKDEQGKGEKIAEVKVRIDWEGLGRRIEHLPLPPGNYRQLAAGDGVLFYLDADEGDFNRFEFRNRPPMGLQAFDFEKRKPRPVVAGIRDYALSADASHLVYNKGDGVLGLLEACARDSTGEALDLSALEMTIDPRREWRQIFADAWRFERNFYYEPHMHGLDWPAMREKYGRLLDRATCRQDVRFVIGELIGELSTSHTYVYGGDRRRQAEQVNVGMLGADWEPADGRWRIRHILRTPEWTHEVLPPLVQPGQSVHEGEYLLAVNGVAVTAAHNLYSYFVDTAGRQVTLTVNDKPTDRGARDVVVVPLRDESTLRYMDWVESNRLRVDELSQGEIGYLHLPDTYVGSAREFGRQFYGQTRKKGLIVDGRYNNGGLDPDIFLERLDRKIHSYWTRRYSHDQTSPSVATRAHMVCLTNRQAGSGGDELPNVFRWRDMGPVIGTRTWGGLVGVSMFIRLIDGGGLTAPDYRIYSPDGRWIIEGVGVEPDIVVELDNSAAYRGEDAQLLKAIEYLQEKIAREPRPWPQHPAYPVQE
jgi:tricorn protease